MSELTPITRKETFLAKAGGQNVVTPTPITREETFLQAIIDNGSGGGGGTGGGVTVLTATVSDDTATMPCTAAELFAYTQTNVVIVHYTATPMGIAVENNVIIHLSQYDEMNGYYFMSTNFEINCSNGTDIPTFSVE